MDIKRIDLGRSHKPEGDHRKATFKKILETIPGLSEMNLVDLGSGPCIFPKIAKECGFSVTAVDARTERLPADLGEIRFVCSDVREFEWKRFGVASVLGLLYHLELREQLELLKNAAEHCDFTIVDTQVHIDELVCTPEPHRFSSQVDLEGGYAGVFFKEFENPMAAVGNEESFWHTEPSILRLFENAGYQGVTIVDPPYQSKHGARRFFFCET